MHPHKPSALLSESDGIPALMPQARRLLELRQILASLLPGALSRACTVANYKQGKLVLFAENNAVAAKLKLLSPTIREQFSDRGVQVTEMDIGVQAPEAAQEKPEKAAKLSGSAVASLAELAAQLPDSPLKQCVAALARHDVSKP
ncbi:MAG TPA: DciA family protein [Burkholderiales bacterium]